ncbi:hypothetical protein [Neolewinella agarilytica]|nr:hypothetical protein [Neolewinella agarilytica]
MLTVLFQQSKLLISGQAQELNDLLRQWVAVLERELKERNPGLVGEF